MTLLYIYIIGYIVWAAMHIAPPYGLVSYEPEIQSKSYYIMGFFVWWFCVYYLFLTLIYFVAGIDKKDINNE